MEPQGVEEAVRLVSLSPWPLWLRAALVLAAVVGFGLAVRGLAREGQRLRRLVLATLRAVAMVAVIFVALEPAVRTLQLAQVKERLVLVDVSASMAFPAEAGGATRAAAAAAWLAAVQGELDALATSHTIEVHRFDRDVVAADRRALAAGAVPSAGPTTDLLGALRAISAPGAGGGKKLAGVLVVSDGADHGELGREGVEGATKEALQGLRAPLSVVATGEGDVPDLSLEALRVDDFAFVRSTVTIEATLRATGLGALDVPVRLEREGRVVAQQLVHVPSEGGRFPVQLSFVPDQIGELVLTLRAPIFDGEAVTANNERSFVLEVIRDRVRTLLVVGRPSWDERFLRGLLKQDPNVDLISFFILRTPQDDPRTFSQNELALIPFPTDEIFDKQLGTFDLVIFQDFSWRPYEMRQYLPNLRDYVEGGGAFVMIGGEGSFDEGGYYETPLGDVLPVMPGGARPDELLFRPTLTPAGQRHPITRLEPSLDANGKTWAALPELPGTHVVRLRPGAHALLEHPSLTSAGAKVPILAIHEFGRGRAMALTTDASWHWSMLAAAGNGGSPRAYERFWSNAIRWLVRDPELTPVLVRAISREIEPGTPLAAVVTARRADYQAAPGASVELELVDARAGQVVGHARGLTGEDGTVRLELPPQAPGPYALRATATLDGQALGAGSDAVAVRAASAELSDASARPELLRAVAEATGGGFTTADDGVLPALGLPEPELVEVGRSKDEPIWDRAWLLALLVAVLGAEWLLRRRWGWF